MSNLKITPELLASADAESAEEFHLAFCKLFDSHNSLIKANAKLTADLAELSNKLDAIQTAQGNYIPRADLESTIKSAIPENVIKLARDEGSKAAAEALAATGSGSPVPPSPAEANKTSKQDFNAVVKANVANGMKPSDAILAAIKSNPAEYAEARATGSFNF